MPAIHLIKNDPRLPEIRPVAPGSNIYRSGFWRLALSKAKALEGGKIYFHEKQKEPSFFGGTIANASEIPYEGEKRIEFTFKSDPACKGVTTGRHGWKQEMKIFL